MLNATQILELEEVSLNAWPALAEVLYDGWVVRFANGFTRRSNSVTPLHAGRMDVWEKIRFCEQLYARHHLPAIFKMTVASQPAGLDAALAGSGFHRVPGAIVKVAELEQLPVEADPRVVDSPVDQWSAAVVQAGHLPSKHAGTLRAIVNAIALPRFTALLMEGDHPIASGLAVVQDEWVGLFDIATDPQFRRRGFANAMIGNLLHWAKANGAKFAYLQVAPDNAPARQLYTKLGFREAYEYEYWQRPS